MKSNKTDNSKGFNTATTKPKTKAGLAIATIWGGFKGIFTGNGPVQSKSDGTGVVLKDSNGAIILDRPVNNTNWQNILAGIGLLVGGIAGTTPSDLSTDQQYNEIQNQQEIRTGSNTLLLVGVGTVVLFGSIWAYLKFKD